MSHLRGKNDTSLLPKGTGEEWGLASVPMSPTQREGGGTAPPYTARRETSECRGLFLGIPCFTLANTHALPHVPNGP